MNKLIDWATKDWATVGNVIPAKDGRLIVAGSHIMSAPSGSILFRAVCIVDEQHNITKTFYAIDGSNQEQELDNIIEKWRI